MSLMRLLCLISMLLFSSLGWTQERGTLAHPQSQLWALQESGATQTAELLESQLRSLLSTADLKNVRHLGGGLSESWLVQLPENVFAVLKPADRKNPRSPFYEVAAYELDRLLKLNMVPMTVLRTIGTTTYSLQVFYPSSDRFKLNPTLADIDELRIKDIHLFDFLAGNQDRSLKDAHNALEGKNGRLIAIDHGFTFSANYRSYDRLQGGSENFKEALLNLTLQDLQRLSGLLNESELKSLEGRVVKLQAESSKMSWTASGASETTVLHKTYETPTELVGKAFVDLNVIKSLAVESGTMNSLESLKEIFLRDPVQSASARALFLKWPTFTATEKEYLLRLIETVSSEKQIIPDQTQRLLRQYPEDLFLLDKTLRAASKGTFAYAMFVHEISMRSSKDLSGLAKGYLKSKYGADMISRSFYNLDLGFKSAAYRDTYLETVNDFLRNGSLRWGDLLSLPEDRRIVLAEVISQSFQGKQIKNVLEMKLDTLSLDQKEKAQELLQKIKGTMKAPLCRAIFN